MAEALPACSAIGEILRPGRFGNASGPAGVTMSECIIAAAAGLAARSGAMAELEHAASRIGLSLPPAGRWQAGGGWQTIWLGPERWLVFGQHDVEQVLRDVFGGLASVSDQSDSRVVLEVAGLRVRDALAKGLQVDLHPHVFTPSSAAVTTAAHIGVVIWQVDTAPAFRIAAARSYAASLAEWLLSAAAEYGLEVLPPSQ